MSYTVTDWKTGDYITVSKLNKIEQGIAAASSAIQIIGFSAYSANGFTLDHTFKWIYDAVSSGSLIVVLHEGRSGYVKGISFYEESDYFFGGVEIGSPFLNSVTTDQWNGYPMTQK